jgi:hypothetical protein
MSRRRVHTTAAVALLVALVACSGGSSGGASDGTAVTFAPAGQGGSTTTPSQTVPGSSASSSPLTTAPPATLPSSVAPGTGVLVIGPLSVTVGITLCNLTPETDAATGVTTNLLVTGDDGQGGTLTISQRQTTTAGAATTITERVSYTRGDNTLESTRIELNGSYHDLRDPTATGALLVVDGDRVQASGTFGSPGTTAGDASLATGAVLARCPAP